MSKIKLTSWVPIRNVVSEDSIVHKNFNNCLENLISSGTFALKNLSNKIVDAVLSLKEPPSKVLKPLTLLNYDGYLEKLKYCTFVRIDAEMNYNLKEINSSNTKKLNKDDLIGIGACDLSLFIQDLFILCSLAYPGHFHTEIGQVFFSVLPMNTVE